MLFVVLCPGTPEGSTGSGSGFKASQKTGQRLKVSSDRLGEAGNRTCDPWFTRHSAYPLHHGGHFVYKHALRHSGIAMATVININWHFSLRHLYRYYSKHMLS